MNHLSRRNFLKQSWVAACLPWFNSRPNATGAPLRLDIPSADGFYGRAFHLADIYAQPYESSAVAGQLLPDSVTSLRAVNNDSGWYQLSDNRGYIRSTTIQPILPYTRPEIVETVGNGFWAEMIAPVSAVHEWCAGHAPIVARLGYGAMVYVIDRLRDGSKQDWYGLAAAPNTELIGWASALHYARWRPQENSVAGLSLNIVTESGELLILDHGKVIAWTTFAGQRLPSAETSITIEMLGGPVNSELPLGLPWLMRLESGQRVSGVFWHNNFGAHAGARPDQHGALELPTFAAGWLYQVLMKHHRVAVVIE